MKSGWKAIFSLGTASLALFATAQVRAQESGFRWQPEQASKIAPRVDLLFDFLLVVSGLITGGICLLIVIFVFKYRRGNPADRSNAPTRNWKLESAWIGIPILLSLFTFVWSARLFYDEYAEPAGALNINVVGQQWFWEMQHPEGPREMDELHIPVGRPIKLTLSSQDVIHDFYVPAFRVKQDALPGRLTSVWFTATQPGRYHLFCAQYCGTQHSNMGGWVYVMEPGDYERWLTHTKPQPSLAEAGEKLFVQFSCAGCHGSHAAVRAPSLDGIYGRTVPLADGSMVRVDDRYLYDSIVLPGAQVAAGYQNIMPTYKGSLTQAQLLELVAYLRSLGSQTAHEKSLDTGDATTRQAIREQQQRALKTQQEDQEMQPRQAPADAMPSGDKNLRPLPQERKSLP
jgi:cytochrome c oxidase subunit 2